MDEKGAPHKVNNVTNEKSLVPFSPKDAHPAPIGSADRDTALAKVEMEKRYALIKAWEENEKAKVDNKALKKMSAIESWENSKKVSVEARLKKLEEKVAKKKAQHAEKINNKKAGIHKAAEERRAVIEAKRSEESLKLEETAAKYRATGHTPKKHFACFGS